jgi:hypothetical protein
MPVVDYFEKQNKVVKVSAAQRVGDVYDGVVKGLAEMGVHPEK